MRTQAVSPPPLPPAPLPRGALRLDPLDCAWVPYARGRPAEPSVRDWLQGRLAAVPQLPRDRYGRPRPPSGSGFDVSWSHSGGGLLMALGRGVRVGCDLEWLRPRPQALELARRFFHPRQAAWLEELAPSARERRFVQLWCAKEAVLKAHGRGLAFGLHRLRFAGRGDALAMVDCDPALGVPADWALHAFAPAPGYLATLAWSAAARASLQ